MTFHKLDHNPQNYPDFYEIGEFYNVGKGLRELLALRPDGLVLADELDRDRLEVKRAMRAPGRLMWPSIGTYLVDKVTMENEDARQAIFAAIWTVQLQDAAGPRWLRTIWKRVVFEAGIEANVRRTLKKAELEPFAPNEEIDFSFLLHEAWEPAMKRLDTAGKLRIVRPHRPAPPPVVLPPAPPPPLQPKVQKLAKTKPAHINSTEAWEEKRRNYEREWPRIEQKYSSEPHRDPYNEVEFVAWRSEMENEFAKIERQAGPNWKGRNRFAATLTRAGWIMARCKEKGTLLDRIDMARMSFYCWRDGTLMGFRPWREAVLAHLKDDDSKFQYSIGNHSLNELKHVLKTYVADAPVSVDYGSPGEDKTIAITMPEGTVSEIIRGKGYDEDGAPIAD
jgi:hypothetical protein